MAGPQVFHIGIVVNDIDRAIEDFGELLGYTFEAPIERRVTGVEVHGEPAEYDLRFVYSNEGPPYLELIEADDRDIGGMYNSRGEGLHHIGVWQEDVPGRVERLVDQGHDLEFAARRGPDDDVMVCYFGTEHPTVHGTRIEYLHPGPVIRGFDAEGRPIG